MSDFPRPRSTPIPGTSTIVSGTPGMPGNSTGAPPSPTEFVNRETFAAPPPGATQRPTLPGMYPEGAEDFQFVPLNRRKRRRGIGWVFFVLLISAGPVIGIGVGIWAVLKAKDAVDQASDLSDPDLSDTDREALGLPDGVETLFEADAVARIAAVYEQAIAGDPTRFSQILIYKDYAFATAQNPDAPTHLDQYPWRSGKVGRPSAQNSVADVESILFSASDIDWRAVSAAAADAASLSGVEGGSVSHIIVEHSTFKPSYPATVRIFVTGARGSGFIEMSPTGEILASF